MTDGFDDDALGYKRPPRWSRFRKGKSGNPAGRPRRKAEPTTPVPASTHAEDILRRELRRKHKLKEGGNTIEATMLEVVNKAQLAAAAKGNVIAQRDVLKRAAELEIADAERVAEADRKACQTFDNIVWWREERASVWAAAAREGREPEDPWPHPDDMFINRLKGTWYIRGPLDEEQLPEFRYFQAERDFHFSALVLRQRQARNKAQTRTAHIMHWCWAIYDAWLPKRWQIGGDQLHDLIALYWLFPIEDLKADVQRFEALADGLRPEPKPHHRRDIYRSANRLMKPLLKPMGYRSLAQFEHAFEQDRDNLPWPRLSR